ncbi:MAG: CopD family protein [Rhodospirillales bacterium]|nr:CopD family protein [Rhodospirillales bacterium]
MSPDGMTALALLRGTHVAALLVLVGTIGFRAFVLRDAAEPGLGRLAFGAAALALGLGAAWFLAEAAQLGQARSLGAAFATIPALLTYFVFARWLALRLGLLAVAVAWLAAGQDALPAGRRLALLAALAGGALALQPLLGHAGAARGTTAMVLTGAAFVHLAGAALWLGGLPAFALVVRRTSGASLARAAHRFSTLALRAVVAIALAGATEGWILVGSLARLTDTRYGSDVTFKTALFAAALTLAAANRLVLTPRLDGPEATVARRRLQATVGIETAIGLAIILTAGFLSDLPPGADAPVSAPHWSWLPGGGILLAAAGLALWFARPKSFVFPFKRPGATNDTSFS